MIISIFSATAMVAMELPDYSARELERATNNAEDRLENLYSNTWKQDQYWINSNCERIQDALRMIEFSNSKANTEHPDEIGKISDEDMKKLKHTFYTKLQTVSQEKAKKYIKKYAAYNSFYQAAQVVNMQDKLCRNFIKAEDSHCAFINEILKELLRGEIHTRNESLETKIQDAPHILAKDIKGMTERSEKNILNMKQEQQNLTKIWNDLNL
jgi:hypothetical protein